ncbi:Proline iminopeptidase [Escovopsis weberi]|uniref:Proline iminopeptidase n=1 Tax=Escovopsis weberi TaxID=150374 RepID=A0A0M8N1T2_ESCWE|nr:Proline iminopeptidase [Escovopsis weberi]
MASLASREPEIPPARIISSKAHVLPGQLLAAEIFFQVPLDYSNPSAGSLTLFARSVTKHETPIFAPEEPAPPRPFLVYLEGGPGFGNREPQDHPLTRPALARGYQVLFLDHRGVGLSTPVSAEMLARLPGGTGPRAVQVQAGYLELMRQDSTVRDCEAVRKALTLGWPDHKARWSIFGQSYGGFVALSYLSLHPHGLREVFLTGGLAPVGRGPDAVYAATFRRTAERNLAYWAKFPEDARVLAQVAAHVRAAGGDRGLPLPAGGFLTVPRLLTMGIRLGYHGGVDHLHGVLLQLKASLDQHGFLSRASLALVEAVIPFDTNPIYALLHEAIYCDGPGVASNWSAYRVGQSLDPFRWLRPSSSSSSCSSFSTPSSAPAAAPAPAPAPASAPHPLDQNPVFFSGEMIFPFFFDTWPELIPLKPVAERLAAKSDWPPLYDQDQLRRNQVPVYAVSYIDDMFVDYGLARDTTRIIRGIKTFETNAMYHTALQARSDEVIAQLFNLRDDTLD